MFLKLSVSPDYKLKIILLPSLLFSLIAPCISLSPCLIFVIWWLSVLSVAFHSTYIQTGLIILDGVCVCF